jgi:hypothetical protein
MTRLALVLPVLASLPGQLRGCGAAHCPGDELMETFLAEPDLCGPSATAVDCQVMCPEGTVGVIPPRVRVWEEAIYMTDGPDFRAGDEVEPGPWRFDLVDPALLRFDRVPPDRGVPVHPPLAAIRSGTTDLQPGTTRMSAYVLTSDVRDGCVLDLAVAWSWTLRGRESAFAGDYEASVKVLGGHCPPYGRGDAWKIGGKLLSPG